MVSIIVPVYNIEMYIDRCVQSLISQNQNIEIILIDDGSTDNSAQICDKYASEYSNIRSVHILNAGVSNARNIGLSLAKGEYITFVDGDDWLSRNFLEIGIRKLKETGADIFMGSYIENYSDGTEIEINKDTTNMMLNYQECIEAVFIKSKKKQDLSWAIWGKIFKASLWEKNSFDTSFSMGEDALAFWNILKNTNKVLYMPVMGYHYLQRADSVMHTFSSKNIFDNLKMFQFFYNDSKLICNKVTQNYFLQRYYMEEVEAILRLSLLKHDNKHFYKLREKLYFNIDRYFKAAWNLNGIHGMIKIFLATMPVFCIRNIFHVYDIIKRLFRY